jgi:hypothetical protein
MPNPTFETGLSRREADTLTRIHAIADALEHERRVSFGKAVICTGAAIIAQAEGPAALRAMLRAMGWTAKGAYDEGRTEA